MSRYKGSNEQIAGFAAKALSLMTERQALPHPQNYALWYGYAAGQPMQLVKALDALVGSKQPFTEEIGQQLADQHLESAHLIKVTTQINMNLEKKAKDILDQLEDMSTGTSQYGKTLAAASGRLGAAEGIGAIKQVIGSLITDTQSMAARTQELERRVEASTAEVTALRTELAASRQEAMTDGLTAVANRKFFDFRLREDAMSAMEVGESLSLVMIDIDHFKRFNDTYGHPMGDQVLRLVARVIADNVKGRDTPARYGGEEFAVILPNTTLSDAAIVAEQIRRAMSKRRIMRRDTSQDLGSVTMSMGVSQYRPGEQLQYFIDRADAALYQAKRAGRDRVLSELDVK
jgi:diguanylate cyclase